MKKNLFIALAALTICGSCSNESYLPGSEQELAELNGEYEKMKYHTEKFEGEDDLEKIETSADEATIKASMDEYVTELMNRTATAKEKVMRSTYSATATVVGVFKVGSCGTFKELYVSLDCEDTKESSFVSGDVGDTFVDGAGNVNLQFCLVAANRFYPGGVFLVNHVNYSLSDRDSRHAVVRHHDSDDKNPNNHVSGTHPDYLYKENLSGYTKIDRNTTLAWMFPDKLAHSGWDYINANNIGFGPTGNIKYGVLTSALAASGYINVDDEDSGNTNWIKRYRDGYNLDGGFDAWTASNECGIFADKNTVYNVSVSTSANFSKNNHFQPLGRPTF